jgi:hypothetical protein
MITTSNQLSHLGTFFSSCKQFSTSRLAYEKELKTLIDSAALLIKHYGRKGILQEISLPFADFFFLLFRKHTTSSPDLPKINFSQTAVINSLVTALRNCKQPETIVQLLGLEKCMYKSRFHHIENGKRSCNDYY